jgi:predicted TIM-barrel fold metal-dependent hydrolase
MAKGKVMQKIIDSHFHIWRQNDLPWLVGPMVPRIFGPYEPIRRDYTIGEFLDDQKHSGVEKAVYVQTNWAKEHFEDEVAWVQATADETGWPHAIVGYADMSVDDVRPQLDRLKRYPLVRGVRMQLHWHETPDYRFAPSPDQVVDPAVRVNVARLKDYGLSFDLQLFPAQMAHGARLVAENPETQFVLTHTGMLTDMSPDTVEAWEQGLRTLAAHPNVNAKLSGLGTFVHRNDPDLIAFVINRAIDIFGADRLMFGSNFPIEKLWIDHKTMTGSYRAAVASLAKKDQADIFWNTAECVYRPI